MTPGDSHVTDKRGKPPTGDGDGAGAHDELELDFLGFGPVEGEIQIGKVFPSQRERDDRVALLLVAEVGRVDLDNVALA